MSQSEAGPVFYTHSFGVTSSLPYSNEHSVNAGGDVNADGVPDIIVGEHFDNFGQNDGGEATVYSGMSGEAIHYFGRFPYGSLFGSASSGVGDVNADGYDDVAVSALGSLTPGNNFSGSKVLVYSGINGEVLYSLETRGEWVAEIGDTDGDGYDDLLTRSGNSSGSTSTIFSGATGQTLFSFPGVYPEEGLQVGDLNGDNIPESMVGSYSDAKIVSSFDGSTLYSLKGYKKYSETASDAGDVNGDGIADLILGSLNSAKVRSGADGSIIHNFISPGTTYLIGGGSVSTVSGVGDINNDGYADLLVGNKYEDDQRVGEVEFLAGSARLYSGIDGSVLHHSKGFFLSGYGSNVGELGDMNGDGVNDFYVGADGDSSSSSFFAIFVSNVVPEPSTISLLGIGLSSLLIRRRGSSLYETDG